MSLSICPWKYDKQWVYSITYDEALVELHRFAVPMHEEYGLPGHVEVVVGQMGAIREIGNSSYNGFRHMNGEELKELMAEGWGVGNHSWSHQTITSETVDQELRQAKEELEAAIAAPVLLYCSPGDNTNMAAHVLEACRRYGYLGAMSITDALNRPEDELFWINRTPLHDHYYAPFYSAYDPYRNIRYAQAVHGWIIDYCHCPLETPVHPNKDCSHAQLRQRFETVLSEGGDGVWCAVPEEVIGYHILRRHTRIEPIDESALEYRYRLYLDGLPHIAPYRALTLEALVPAAWCRDPHAWIGGHPVPAALSRPQTLQITLDVHDGMEIVFRQGGNRTNQ
jgi:hypothetical protein